MVEVLKIKYHEVECQGKDLIKGWQTSQTLGVGDAKAFLDPSTLQLYLLALL